MDEIEDEIELKPCPFCGGDAEMQQGKHQGLGIFYVSCLGCGLLLQRLGERTRMSHRA